MALDKTKFELQPASVFTSGLTNASHVSTCNRIYSVAASIDLEDLIDRYNSLEHAHTSAELTSLSDLKTDIESAYSLMDGLIKSNPSAVTGPAISMKGYLSKIRSLTETAIKNCRRSVKHPAIGLFQGVKEVVGKTQSTMHKVDKAYKKFTGPAEGLFNKVEESMEKGPDYSKILRRK